VFTHISDLWSAWLGEMHRLLAPDGLLLASFLGEGMWEALVTGPYVEDEVGMAVLRRWQGPYAWVFHSEWWLREHWGRAFDVLHVERPPTDSQGATQVTHSYVVLRKRDVAVSREALEWVDPAQRRELPALQTSLSLARADIDYLMSRASDETQHTPRGLHYLRQMKRHLRARLPHD
jgi:hypothetical protein